ncbi:hypothetical protein [Macrococcoides caseolyticum]|nr:hypothetical protein [Macrococcus caseolyticus]
MTPEQHIAMLKMLNNVKVEKYVTHEDYTELVVIDKDKNKMEIKFYPKKN